MTRSLDRPIFVIGTHRSGTTLLARALEQHPEVAYWEEPRQVWTWGNNFRPDDHLEASDARPGVRRHVRRQFARFVENAGRPRLAEKTPSNCLRLPFIEAIFPDALYIHIFRDGRAVVHSTDVVRRTRKPEGRWYAERLLGTPVWEWPALASRVWYTAAQRWLGKKMTYWGPRPAGWRSWLRGDTHLVVLAKQWRYTLEPVLEFRTRVPEHRWLDVRYEDLVAQPARYAQELRGFGQLASSRDFDQHLEHECRRDRTDAWRSKLETEQLDTMRSVLEPPLEQLGYVW